MKKVTFLILLSFAFQVQLWAQNQAPILANDTFYLKAGNIYQLPITANDYDPDGNIVLISYCYSNSANFNTSGDDIVKDSMLLLVYIPPEVSGKVNLQYNVYDNHYASASQDGSLILFVENQHSMEKISINNIVPHFYPAGNYFWNMEDTNYCEVPRGSGKTTLFSSGLQVGGKTSGEEIRLASFYRYSSYSDFYAGPIQSMAQNPSDFNTMSRVWKVSRLEIEQHKFWSNFPNYKAIDAIENWPAHGDTSLGQSFYLAPFIDKNNNGLYEPEHGDYPDIEGDEAVYMIFNDANNAHWATEGNPMGIEVHQMSWAYACPYDSAFNNTFFTRYTIHNRSSESYHDMLAGIWTDFDIGYAGDDLVGCDTNRNYFFAYNNKPVDGGIQDSYGAYPPMQAIKFLSQKMNFTTAYSNGQSGLPLDPNADKSNYNLLRCMWNDSTPITYGGTGNTGTTPTHYMFPSDPRDSLKPNFWADSVVQPTYYSDKRMSGTIAIPSLPAGSSFTFDIAYIYARQDTSHYLNTIDVLNAYADRIQWAYDNDSFPCVPAPLGLKTYEKADFDFYVFPNPAEVYVQVVLPEEHMQAEFSLFNLAGQQMHHDVFRGRTKLNVSELKNGIYFLRVVSGDASMVKKIVIR